MVRIVNIRKREFISAGYQDRTHICALARPPPPDTRVFFLADANNSKIPVAPGLARSDLCLPQASICPNSLVRFLHVRRVDTIGAASTSGCAMRGRSDDLRLYTRPKERIKGFYGESISRYLDGAGGAKRQE